MAESRGASFGGVFKIVFYVVASLLILGAIGFTIFGLFAAGTAAKAKAEANKDKCIHNQFLIDVVKADWARDNNKPDSATPSESDLTNYFQYNLLPYCPGGGEYRIGAVTNEASCTLHPRN